MTLVRVLSRLSSWSKGSWGDDLEASDRHKPGCAPYGKPSKQEAIASTFSLLHAGTVCIIFNWWLYSDKAFSEDGYVNQSLRGKADVQHNSMINQKSDRGQELKLSSGENNQLPHYEQEWLASGASPETIALKVFGGAA